MPTSGPSKLFSSDQKLSGIVGAICAPVGTWLIFSYDPYWGTVGLGTALLTLGFALLARAHGRSEWHGLWGFATGMLVFFWASRIGQGLDNLRRSEMVIFTIAIVVILGWSGYLITSSRPRKESLNRKLITFCPAELVRSWPFLTVAGLALLYITFVMTVPPRSGKAGAITTACISNLKQCGIGMIMYAEDADGKLPVADTWMDAIGPYTKDDSILACPKVRIADGSATYGRAMNRFLSKAKLATLEAPDQTHLIYDSARMGRNISEFTPSFPAPPRHGIRDPIFFADTHVARSTQRSAAARPHKVHGRKAVNDLSIKLEHATLPHYR